MRKLFTLFILLLSVVLSVSCSKKEEGKQEEKPDPARQETYVTINGEKITKGEFSDFISYSVAMLDPEGGENKEVMKDLKEDFIRHRVLLMEARRLKLQIDEKGFAEMIASFKTEKGEKLVNEFEEVLNIDFEPVKDILHQRAEVAMLLSGLEEDVSVSDRELRQYFKEKKTELTSGKRVHILHIVTSEEVKAQEAVKMLKKGISFGEVAEKYSVSPEGANGGDLGTINLEEFPEIFSESLKLKPGETSGILKSEFGWHIIKLVSVKDGGEIDFEDVKDGLYDELYAVKLENKVKEYTDELLKKAEIVFAGGTAGSAPAK